MRRRRQLTDREWKWLWEYTRTGSNASQAARIVYGGTLISVRVKGHKKKVKLKPILDKIDKIWQDGFLRKRAVELDRAVDAYLKRLKRRAVRVYELNFPEQYLTSQAMSGYLLISEFTYKSLRTTIFKEGRLRVEREGNLLPRPS